MTVLSYLMNLSKKGIIRDQEKEFIRTSIATIKQRLDSAFGDKIKEQFIFGSYTRDTILPRSMDEQSDIDYMIVFNDDDVMPQSYLSRLKSFVKKRYPSSEKKQSHPTIKLDLNHITFELVPALKKCRSGYKIPTLSDRGDDWMDTDPNDFNDDLTEKNKKYESLVKPVIRLMKYWNAQNGYIYDSFELEKWIIERDFSGVDLSPPYFTERFLDPSVHTPNLKKYFFQCIGELGIEPPLTENNKNKVNFAKGIIAEVKNLEDKGYPAPAEDKIKKLLP
ncbi:MAG: nucleotidyltransferase domain-containing protein [Chlamydiota bacterium]